MKKINTRQMVKISLLIAISIVLYFFELRIIPGSPLKIDLSDVPVIIAGIFMGPWQGIIVAILKNLLHFLFISSDGHFAGELANLFFAILVMLPVAVLKSKTKTGQLSIYVFTTIFSALMMHILNYYVTFPLYGLTQNGAWEVLTSTFLPFNLMKAGLLMVIVAFIKPLLQRVQ